MSLFELSVNQWKYDIPTSKKLIRSDRDLTSIFQARADEVCIMSMACLPFRNSQSKSCGLMGIKALLCQSYGVNANDVGSLNNRGLDDSFQ